MKNMTTTILSVLTLLSLVIHCWRTGQLDALAESMERVGGAE